VEKEDAPARGGEVSRDARPEGGVVEHAVDEDDGNADPGALLDDGLGLGHAAR
jgi:hypothetical protein